MGRGQGLRLGLDHVEPGDQYQRRPVPQGDIANPHGRPSPLSRPGLPIGDLHDGVRCRRPRARRSPR